MKRIWNGLGSISGAVGFWEVISLYRYFKRVLDFVLSGLALIVLWPVFLVIGLIIKIDSRGPVLFKQRRIGRDKREFYLLKFRTMRIDAPKDIPTHMLQGPELYITRIGKFLRKSSLDELPQIINIRSRKWSLYM